MASICFPGPSATLPMLEPFHSLDRYTCTHISSTMQAVFSPCRDLLTLSLPSFIAR